MANSFNLGLDAIIYWGTAATTAAGELANVQDVVVSSSRAEIDASTRSSSWKLTMGGLLDVSIDFGLIMEVDDTGFDALKAAHFGNTAIALLVLDKPSGEGPDADFIVTKFDRDEGMGNTVSYSVTVKPAATGRAPSWEGAST